MLPAAIAATHNSGHVSAHLTFFQAIVLGAIQGVAELFPISSLGHTVIVPKLLGWNGIVKSQSASESFYLAFVVGLHVANALALLVFFWRDWVRIVKAFLTSVGASIRARSFVADTPDQRLAWLIVVASVPTGLIGISLEHSFRTLLAKPLAAAAFLMVNGVILIAGERLRRRSEVRALAASAGTGVAVEWQPEDATGRAAAPGTGDPDGQTEPEEVSRSLATLKYREAAVIGVVQSLALIAGFSRDGLTMVAGLLRGLDNIDAARFAFLLATPIILAAGVYKVPDLLGPNGNGVRGQVLAGSLVTFAVSLIAVGFLARYFRTRNLTPFGIYCLVFAAVALVVIGL